jgi:hypothetical protein
VERNKILKSLELEGDFGTSQDLQPEMALFSENSRLDNASIQALREQKKTKGKGKGKGKEDGEGPKHVQVKTPHENKAQAYKDSILTEVGKASSLCSDLVAFSWRCDASWKAASGK